MPHAQRKTKVHCFTTTNPRVKIAIYCAYGYWRDNMFAYYIRGVPLIKYYSSTVFETAANYDNREVYAATSRYSQKDFDRVVTLVTKAATDLQQNVYNETVAAYWLNIVLANVINRVKTYRMLQDVTNLRVFTAEDHGKTKRLQTQEFVCSTTT